MSAEYLESKRRKKKKFSPSSIVPLTKEREQIEEKRIREAYDREARKEVNNEQEHESKR